MNDRAGHALMDDLRPDDNKTPLNSDAQPLFEAAFREHHSQLINYLRRCLHNDNDARDMAQEA